MGNCCTYDVSIRSQFENNREFESEEEVIITNDEGGGRIRLKGSSKFVSMYSQQGKKGVNQDSMTVWEDFTGQKDTIFCGVFDGHGRHGHVVSRFIRNNLPSKLSAAVKMSQQKLSEYSDANATDSENNDQNMSLSLASWENCFVKSFNETDEDVAREINTNSFCSGSTAVTIIKQGDQLVIGNLGDSRAVLCTKGDKDELVPVQLTVDLKPNLPSEAARIQSCEGRIFAEEEEPEVFRLWMPEENCPGLAMSRAFGDFCLKDYGLIAIPDISFRKITKEDEFVVLATDGVWDVLTNEEVINIVASAPRKSIAAKLLVKSAVKAWKYKFPGVMADDCAAICLFLKDSLTKSSMEVTEENKFKRKKKHGRRSSKNVDTQTVLVATSNKDNWEALKGLSRANSLTKIPRLAGDVNQPASSRLPEAVEVH